MFTSFLHSEVLLRMREWANQPINIHITQMEQGVVRFVKMRPATADSLPQAVTCQTR